VKYLIIIIALLLMLAGCSTKNIGTVDAPAMTVKYIIWEGVTWRGIYYDDRWHWEVVDG